MESLCLVPGKTEYLFEAPKGPLHLTVANLDLSIVGEDRGNIAAVLTLGRAPEELVQGAVYQLAFEEGLTLTAMEGVDWGDLTPELEIHCPFDLPVFVNAKRSNLNLKDLICSQALVLDRSNAHLRGCGGILTLNSVNGRGTSVVEGYDLVGSSFISCGPEDPRASILFSPGPSVLFGSELHVSGGRHGLGVWCRGVAGSGVELQRQTVTSASS